MADKQVRVGVGVCIMRGHDILIGLRKGSHGDGTWCFPGGHLEYGESLEACAAREVLEETGLVTKHIRFASVTNDIFEQEEKQYVTIFMMADYDGGDAHLLEPEKCTEWKWCHWDDIPENVFEPLKSLQAQGFNPYDC